MDTLNPDFFVGPIQLDLDKTVLRQRPIILRDLVSLGEIGLEIILARPLRVHVDLTVQADRRFHRHAYGHTIQNRQRARQTETHRTGIRIRGFPKRR